MQSIIKEYYHVIGLTPNKSRHQEQVKARAAMMCAMREFKLSTKDIGSVFDTDHSTVCTMPRSTKLTWSIGLDTEATISQRPGCATKR